METKCRAKDPTTCRTHGLDYLDSLRDKAIATGNFGAYLTARAAMDKKSNASLFNVPEKTEIPQEAVEAAAKSNWNGRNGLYDWKDIPESQREELRQSQREALTVALAHMPNRVITDEAIEEMSIVCGGVGSRDWERLSRITKETLRESSRKSLEVAAPHMGIALNAKASISNMFRQMEEKFFSAADRVSEAKENAEGTVVAGMDKIAERHEKPIPAEIGGNTVAWSDLNPFKSPFKNGKLR